MVCLIERRDCAYVWRDILEPERTLFPVFVVTETLRCVQTFSVIRAPASEGIYVTYRVPCTCLYVDGQFG